MFHSDQDLSQRRDNKHLKFSFIQVFPGHDIISSEYSLLFQLPVVLTTTEHSPTYCCMFQKDFSLIENNTLIKVGQQLQNLGK